MNVAGTGVKTKKRAGDRRIRGILSILLPLFLWVGLALGGYFYALNYMQGTMMHFSRQVGELQKENRRIGEDLTGAMQSLQSEAQQVSGELGLIKEQLELAGESITGTDSTRQGLQERMAELDKQLAGLREQLKRLEDATRAF